MRTFETGAIRDSDEDKLDFAGSLSPSVLIRYAEYMRDKRKLQNGVKRSDNNWKKGVPKQSYMESLLRHTLDAWRSHECDGGTTEEEACAIIFNVQGYLHEILKDKVSTK